jgi:outer membrane protein OmpA-like peptidoglycan-associated protein
MIKGLAIIFAVLVLMAATSAYSQSTAAMTSVPPLRLTAYVVPVEAEVVNEPLQRRSVVYQRLCRAQLLAKFNRILPTRDTARGLIVTVPDSLLSNRNTVPPETSKKLAQIAEMLPPDVTVRVEGYTDHRSSNAENEANSYSRAQAVQDVLMSNDSLPRAIAIAGFVSSAPLAGRANRRVEIVISGAGIGQTVASARGI